MKRFFAAFLILATLLSLFACGEKVDPPVSEADTTTVATEITTVTTIQSTTVSSETTTETTVVTEPPVEEGLLYQAHRGYSTKYPENTMPAFQGAIDAGFKLIELDPNFTADGQCILMHDSTINRTCRKTDGSSLGENGIGIGSITYAELQQYDAGIFKGQQFKGTKVPLLADVAKLAEGAGVQLKIDNKIQNYTDQQLEVIFALAEQYPDTIGITCKDLEFVKRVLARLPDAIIHYDGGVSEKICQQLREMVGEDGELYIWFSVSKANANICKVIQKYGKLGLWTVKSEAELQKAIELDADLIETNGEVVPE